MKKKKDSDTPLTSKQARFIEEYLVDLNGTQAAIRAGYSPKTAKRIAYQLFERPTIREAIRTAKQRRSERTGIEQERVLQEEAAIAFSDLKNLFDESGNTIPPRQLPDSVSRALSSIEVIETYDKDGNLSKKYRYRLWDKGRALDRIEKHIGMLGERLVLDLPELKSIKDLPNVIGSLVNAAKGGAIGLTQGHAFIALLEGFRRAAETDQLEARISQLEAAMKK